MKFLVLALCLSAASAASVGIFNPYNNQPYNNQPYRSYTPVNQASRVTQTPVSPFGNAAKAVYKSGQYVANSPVVAAEAVSQTAQYVTSAPVVAAEAVYKTGQYVANGPVVAAEAVSKTAQYATAAPVVAAEAVAKTAQYVTAAPAVAAEAVYKTVPSVSATKAVYDKNEAEAPIVRLDYEQTPNGFNSAYETANGIVSQTTGTLKKVDDKESLTFEGFFRYLLGDGSTAEIVYTADENGYHPQGNILPVAPPTPEAILRALDYISKQPKAPETQ